MPRTPHVARRVTRTEEAPVIPLGAGPVFPAVVSTGAQTGLGAVLVEGAVLFEVIHVTDAQRTWLTVAVSLAVCAAHNGVEAWRGRQLIGRAPAPAVAPPQV